MYETTVQIIMELGDLMIQLQVHPFRISFSSNISPQNLTSETAAYLTTKHPDYAVLGARIAISNLHKETTKNFSQLIKDLYNYGSCHRSSCRRG
jgi:hypothetical protein